MGETRRKKTRGKAPAPKKTKSFCSIPILPPASTFSSADIVGKDFYGWVNNKWISTVSIPPFENDFGVSEEVERCIYNKSAEILLDIKHLNKSSPLKTLAESCLHSRAQHTSVEYLKSVLWSVQCIESKEDIVKHFAALAHARLPSIFSYQYSISPGRKINICLNSSINLLPLAYYTDHVKSDKYKRFLNKVGDLFQIKELSQIYEFEKSLSMNCENMWLDDDLSIKGSGLVRKFPSIPWATWFEGSGLPGWKSMKISYTSPQWIRYIGRMLNAIPPAYWKLLIMRIYILHALPYLPPPFDEIDFEFFGHFLQGQEIKTPQMELLVNTVYKYLPDTFSKIFWKEAGNPPLVKEMEDFSKTLVAAAKVRILQANWMKSATRVAATSKVDKMNMQMVRPTKWAVISEPHLDSKNLLKNIHDLGSWNTTTMFSRVGHLYEFWDEGIFRVNAYYFNETNEIVIPYGTVLSPFYSSEAGPAWNYGALGSAIGHEMCHGFDEDGRNYGANGELKNWWSKSDNIAYKKKTKGLIDLYNAQIVNGKHVGGEKTLSENIADLGGISIALEALKATQEERGLGRQVVLAEFREFFIAFATSWRTKYRKEKLESSIGVDLHAPAFLRVNLIVSQMNEWYEAFGITEESPLFIKEENRITIF